MIRIAKYKKEDKDIWNNFIHNSKNGIFMFQRNFMDYHSDRFVDNSLMFYDEKDNLVALLPANIKNNVLYSHQGLTYGGFIINKDMKQHKMLKCFESLKTYMQEKNISQLVYKTIPHIYHKLPSEEDLYALYFNNAHLLKIEPSTTIFLASPCKMTKGRKAQISRAKREGVVIQESSDFRTFIELENKVLKENHNTKAVHTADELELLNSKFHVYQIPHFLISITTFSLVSGSTSIFIFFSAVINPRSGSNTASTSVAIFDGAYTG